MGVPAYDRDGRLTMSDSRPSQLPQKAWLEPAESARSKNRSAASGAQLSLGSAHQLACWLGVICSSSSGSWFYYALHAAPVQQALAQSIAHGDEKPWWWGMKLPGHLQPLPCRLGILAVFIRSFTPAVRQEVP